MKDKFFVDTNIFVYNRDLSEPEKQKEAARILARLWLERNGRTSIQVLNEYYVTVTQKLAPGLPPEQAWSDVESLLAWRPCPVDAHLLRRAKAIEHHSQLSWWDSLVVGAASACNCAFLLTEDLQDGQIIEEVRIVNPFLHPLEKLASA